MTNIKIGIMIFSLLFASTSYADIFLGVPERPKKEAGALPTGVWQRRLDDIRRIYLKGDYNLCIEELERLLSLGPPPSIKPDLRYLLGLALLQDEQYSDARANFNIILSEKAKGELIEDAFLSIADSYYLEGNYDEAFGSYRKFLLDYPASNSASIANLKLGLCARKKGRWDEAKYYFQKVQAEYPLSMEAKRATELFYEQETYFSVQVGSFQNKDNANALEAELIKKGYDAYIISPQDKGDNFYRVRVGRFSARSEAEFNEDNLKREGFPTKIVP